MEIMAKGILWGLRGGGGKERGRGWNGRISKPSEAAAGEDGGRGEKGRVSIQLFLGGRDGQCVGKLQDQVLHSKRGERERMERAHNDID